MSRSSALKGIFHSDEFTIRSIPANGDCLFTAIAMALIQSQDTDDVNMNASLQSRVKSLRCIVADSMTEDIFDTYKCIAMSGCTDYSWVLKCSSLEEVKSKVLISGFDVGASKCIYADDFALQSLSTKLNMSFLVYNSDLRGRSVSKKRKQCEDNNIKSANNDVDSLINARTTEEIEEISSRCVKILPQSSTHSSSILMLFRTRREHYNVIEYMGSIAHKDISALPDDVRLFWKMG